MPTTDLDKWQVVRAKIVHEDSCIQQRVNWLLAVDGFLFIGLAALAPYAPAPIGRIQSIALPLFGLLASAFVFAGLIAANQAIATAIEELKLLVPGSAARKKLPSLRSTDPALTLGRVSSWGVTIASIVMWLVLFLLFISGYPLLLKG